ncbi:MAG: S-layer protein [Candidatus Aenigmarchaeota archaeon]|nr:S-layer protein [Candidatus Aenigmarchaeota archaeon]
MQFKKAFAAGAIGAMLMASTVLAGSLANLPQPFVTTSGSVDSLIVVGDAAMPSDVVGAINVGTRIGSQSTRAVTTTSTTAGTSVSSGEGKALATSNTKLYLDDTLAKSGTRNTMTGTELPTLLNSGTLNDDDGSTSYNYNQYVDFYSTYAIQFGTISSYVTEPAILMGSFTTSPSTTTYWYKTRIVFEKDVNVTTAAGESIELFGGTYTVSSGTTSSKLVLFGSSNTVTLKAGEEAKVTLDGTEYTVKYLGSESTTMGVVSVNGVSKSVTEAATTKVNGLDIYADNIYYLSSNDQSQNYAKISIGSRTMTLENAKKVTTGSGTTTNIDGTYSVITASDGKISMVEVYTAGKKSDKAFITEGIEYTDPVWQSFSVAFPSASPKLTDASRDKIIVEAASDNTLQMTYKDENNNEATFDWAYLSSTSDTIPELADRDADEIRIVEGIALQLNDYVVTNAGNYGHLFELTNIDADGTSTASLELTDKFSGTKYSVTLGADGEATKVIDGQSYYINATGSGTSGTAYITWGTGSAQRNTGTYTTVWPRIKGKNGEFLALVDGSSTAATSNIAVSVSDAKRIQLPTGALNLSISGGTLTPSGIAMEDGTASVCTSCEAIATGAADVIQLGKTATGGLWYNLSWTGSGTSGTLTVSVTGDDSADTSITGASAILVEEQDSSSNIYSVVASSGTELSGSNRVVLASAPVFTYAEDSASPRSDSYTTEYLDLYGVYAKRTTNDQDRVELWYPDEQVTMDFFVLKSGATTSTSGATTGTTVNEAVPVTTSIAKLDKDVTSADKAEKNIILVGGPCVNTLVKDLLNTAWGSSNSCSTWSEKYQSGEAIIQLIDNAFGTGTSALIVAGTDAADTLQATSALQQYNTKLKDTSGTMVKIVNGVITTATS